MQTLYSWEVDHDIPLDKLEVHLNAQINRSTGLYLANILYLVEVCKYAVTDKAKRMAKYIQTEEDTKASTALADNTIIKFLVSNERFNTFIEKESVKNYLSEDVVKKIFNELASRQRYKEYASLQSPTPELDKEIIGYVLKKVFPTVKDFENHLEESFINYDDDNALILHILGKYTETFNPASENNFFQSIDVWEDEKKFAIDLLAKTIQHSEELVGYIEPNLRNWEMDRVAILDLILLKMAVCELKYFPTVPVKVSINEYIDISKLYSTPRSKDFVNGVLDNIKNQLKQNNELKKYGRGLME